MSKTSKITAVGKGRDPKRESLWRDRLCRQSRGGLSVSVFCRREKLRETAFYYWRREIRRRDGERNASGPLPVARFIELRAAAPTPRAARGRGSLELLLPGDRRLLIGADCDAALLAMVLGVLDSAGASKTPAVSLSNGEGGSC